MVYCPHAMPRLCDHLRSEPFELILSSGFFGFFAHAGVVRALEECKLRPRALGGSSAGALIAALWAAGLSAEDLRDRLFALRRGDFWDPDPRLGILPKRRREPGSSTERTVRPGLLRGLRFDRMLRETLIARGVNTFQDCPIPVRVVVFDLHKRRSVALSQGDLALAVRASCTVPALFQPVWIDGTPFVDGGVGDRAGILAASAGAKVLYHHLPASSPWRILTPSQVDPPSWRDLHVLTEPRLPRLSPFHLGRGPEAYEMARRMALRGLERHLS